MILDARMIRNEADYEAAMIARRIPVASLIGPVQDA